MICTSGECLPEDLYHYSIRTEEIKECVEEKIAYSNTDDGEDVYLASNGDDGEDVY